MTSDDTEYSIQVRLSQLDFISEPFAAVRSGHLKHHIDPTTVLYTQVGKNLGQGD